MPSRSSAREPGRIELKLDQTTFAPGDAVAVTVTVTARDRFTARGVMVELLAVEEIDPFDDEDEYEDDEETADGDNVIPMTFNGEGDDDDEDDEDEDLVTNITFSEEITLATNVALKSGESRTFAGSFTIPEDGQPTYEG